MSSHTSAPSAVSPALLHSVLSLSPDTKRWIVAYSGGVDSHVLLLLCQRFLASLDCPPELIALHVNHQLQDDADRWQLHCQQQAEALGIPFVAESVHVVCGPQQSLEEQARLARYACFEHQLNRGDVLLMGHHQDDQAETVMLRLLRGSGSKGLRAMREHRSIAAGQLHRPLLTIRRQAIEVFARREGLVWVEDPSNQHSHFDRNFLRATCLPIIEQRWPGYRQTLARVATLSADSWQLQKELAVLDFERFGWQSGQASLPITALSTLSPARQKNLLRYWFAQRHLPAPSVGQLEQVLSAVMGAAEDAEPLVTWPGVEVRRFAGRLYCMTALAAVDHSQCFDVNDNQALIIEGVGQIHFSRQLGAGVRYDQRLMLCFRQGGERIRPAGRSGSRSLKKLLQDLSIPTWWRRRLPLLKVDGQLVAVADRVIDQAWLVAPDQYGLVMTWQPEGDSDTASSV